MRTTQLAARLVARQDRQSRPAPVVLGTVSSIDLGSSGAAVEVTVMVAGTQRPKVVVPRLIQALSVGDTVRLATSGVWTVEAIL